MDRSRPWEYQPTGVIESLCPVNLYIPLQTQEDLQRQRLFLQTQATQSTIIGSTLQGIYASSTILMSTFQTQAQVRTTDQVVTYQRLPQPCLPDSAIQTNQISQSVGLPVQPFQFQDCKGLFSTF